MFFVEVVRFVLLLVTGSTREPITKTAVAVSMLT